MKNGDDIVGINWATSRPYGYIGKTHWNLKEGGLAQSNIEKIIKISSTFAKYMEKPHDELEVFNAKIKATRQILELTLDDFIWKKAAEDGNIGPALLFNLAGEVRDFLEMGGKAGRQRLQMQLKLAQTLSSNTSHMQKK